MSEFVPESTKSTGSPSTMPANQSTPEVTRALKPCPFCGSTDLTTVEWVECNNCGAIGAHDYPGLNAEGSAEGIGVVAWNTRTPARGGDELREAAQGVLSKRWASSSGEWGIPEWVETDEPRRFAEQILASTDMAGASVPDRLARRMGAEFVARDDVPPVEGLTSVEGLRPLSDRATPGPWAWEQCGDKEDAPVVGTIHGPDDQPIAGRFEQPIDAGDLDFVREPIFRDVHANDGCSASANAAFAVACVNYVRAVLAAAPKATAAASVRESVARIIDPEAWGYCDKLAEQGNPTPARRAGCADSLAKADAILALTDTGTAATIGGERA